MKVGVFVGAMYNINYLKGRKRSGFLAGVRLFFNSQSGVLLFSFKRSEFGSGYNVLFITDLYSLCMPKHTLRRERYGISRRSEFVNTSE